MIPRETGRGLSISGAHCVAAVERLVGATLVVALPRTAPPSAGHCLGTTEPGGWSGDFLVADWDRRPERRLERRLERRRPRRRLGPASFRAPGVATWSGDSTGGTMRPRRAPTRGAPTVIGNWKFQRSPPPAGLRHDPARNRAGIVHQRRPPRCRCRTTRRGDPCGRPPLNGATVRRPLPGHYRTGGVERRLSSRRLGSASGAASGAASSSAPTGTGVLPGAKNGDVERRHSRRTMRPRRAPTRGAPTIIGDWKFQRSPPPAGLRHDPPRNWAGMSISGAHHVTAVERLVGATLVVALPRTAPPSARHCLGTTEPGGWSGDFLVADWDRRPERRLERRRPRRRLGPASFRAPGVATWSGDSTGGTTRPRRAPTRGAPTIIGDWKFQRRRRGRWMTSEIGFNFANGRRD